MVNKICKKGDLEELSLHANWTRVLEIGPGSSPHPRSTHFIDHTNNLLNRDVGEFIQMDLNTKEALPYKSNYFDFVVARHVVEHINDPRWLLTEISRVGKAGYIEVPTRLSDNLFSVFAAQDSEGSIFSDEFGHKWWFDSGLGGKILITQRLKIINRGFSKEEYEHLAKYFESSFTLSVLWEAEIDFDFSELDQDLTQNNKPRRPLNWYSLPWFSKLGLVKIMMQQKMEESPFLVRLLKRARRWS